MKKLTVLLCAIAVFCGTTGVANSATVNLFEASGTERYQNDPILWTWDLSGTYEIDSNAGTYSDVSDGFQHSWEFTDSSGSVIHSGNGTLISVTGAEALYTDFHIWSAATEWVGDLAKGDFNCTYYDGPWTCYIEGSFEWTNVNFNPLDGSQVVDFNISGTGTASVPIPSAIWLLGSGLIAFTGIQMKLRK